MFPVVRGNLDMGESSHCKADEWCSGDCTALSNGVLVGDDSRGLHSTERSELLEYVGSMRSLFT